MLWQRENLLDIVGGQVFIVVSCVYMGILI